MSTAPPPGDPRELLERGDSGSYSLLELGLESEAGGLRMFVVSRDPLDWLPDRGCAWAAEDGERSDRRVYATLSEVVRRLRAGDGDLAAAVSPLADDALEREEPAARVTRVRAPLGSWEPFGLDAVQDLVREAFGPVDFDGSRVRLDEAEAPHAACPACAGRSFGFPADLTQSAQAMCPPHRAAADAIMRARIERAQKSNGAGWRAIAKASARVNGLPEPNWQPVPERHTAAAPRRNDPCPCGSGRKYKQCCGR